MEEISAYDPVQRTGNMEMQEGGNENNTRAGWSAGWVQVHIYLPIYLDNLVLMHLKSNTGGRDDPR